MKIIRVPKSEWDTGLGKARSAYRLIGPVTDGKYCNFGPLDADRLPEMDVANTRMSAKSVVYPQSQVMFEYTLDENKSDHHRMKEVSADPGPQAVIGIRPCDAMAFVLVRKNFDTPEYQDPYWIDAYESTTLIGHACSAPCSTCFCTTANSGPFDEHGLDILLVDDGDDGYMAKVLTDKGEAFMTAAGWSTPAGGDADGAIAAAREAAEAKIVSHVRTDQLAGKVTTELYEAPFWEDVSFSCINCGTCTYVCPTCWCFDIQDENRGLDGMRMRNWDSCMFPLFTLHGAGHNPRGTKLHRVRQRFMHKLKYYVDRYENGIQCVGCGRCVRYCPVNIDIRKVCDLMNSHNTDACAVSAEG